MSDLICSECGKDQGVCNNPKHRTFIARDYCTPTERHQRQVIEQILACKDLGIMHKGDLGNYRIKATIEEVLERLAKHKGDK